MTKIKFIYLFFINAVSYMSYRLNCVVNTKAPNNFDCSFIVIYIHVNKTVHITHIYIFFSYVDLFKKEVISSFKIVY